MESVYSSIGGLDDVYAVTQVTGSVFRRFTQVVAGTEAQASVSPITYSLAEGRLAAQTAVDSASSVLDALYAIRDKLSIADGMTVPSLRGDATRFSLQVDISTLVTGIDKTVTSSSVSGLNLLSSPSTLIRIQSSDLGGVLTVATQPLDSANLGISDLNVLDQAGTEKAIRAVEWAIRQTSVRYDQLSAAVQGLSYDNGVTSSLVSALSSLSSYGSVSGYGSSGSATTSSSSLARGSLVNITA